VTLSYVQRALQSVPKAELIRFQQALWWNHQDLYIVRDDHQPQGAICSFPEAATVQLSFRQPPKQRDCSKLIRDVD
jgi:hypothetical protein